MAEQKSSGKRVFFTTVAIVLLLFLAPFLLSAFDYPAVELDWLWMLVGGTISVVGAFELIVCAVRSTSLTATVPWIIVLLAGSLVLSQHWSIAISLAAIGIALILKEVFQQPERPLEE